VFTANFQARFLSEKEEILNFNSLKTKEKNAMFTSFFPTLRGFVGFTA